MKRITCFITSLSSGGAEHQIALLSGFLAERGYDVTLTTFGLIKDHYQVDERVKRYRIKHNGRGWSKLMAVFYYFLTVKTDCVISFGSRENFLCLIPLLFRRKIKMLAGERCATKADFFWIKPNYNWLYKRASYVVPNNYTQQKEIAEKWPKILYKTKAITNFTDVNQYEFAAMPHNSSIQIGIFCRFSKQKNYHRFARVVAVLKAQSNVKFEVHWYGNKHKENQLSPQYIEMDGLRRMYHLEECLFLHDHTKDVSKKLKSFDALCLPSLWEGFSNSISEYICTGRPVLCSDVADNNVMVHDGENGYLFDPENEDNIVETFMKFFSLSDAERDEMGKKSRSIAESLFDKDKFVESYIKLIEQ